MDTSAFREAFPEFSDADVYTETLLQRSYDVAMSFHSLRLQAVLTKRDILESALFLLTAHLVHLSGVRSTGGQVGQVASAAIDKVNVSLVTFTAKSAQQHWLMSTPYGQEWLALTSRFNVGLLAGGAAIGAVFRDNTTGVIR